MIVVEGAGGLLVPLTRGVSTLDFAASLGLPLIIVARAGLGTINHSLLTVRAARDAGLKMTCVIVNRTQPAPDSEDERLIEADNVRIISEAGEVSVVGPLPFLPGAGVNAEVSRQLAVQLEKVLSKASITF
jgi:dethiobiotin synthetase